MRHITWILLAIILLGALSYYSSKQNAKELVGATLDYCRLTKTEITVDPFEKKRIVWGFKFSRPGSFDEEFYIYTSLWGRVVITIPRDLEARLRKLEKMETYPYSKLKK